MKQPHELHGVLLQPVQSFLYGPHLRLPALPTWQTTKATEAL